jgi:PPK2 family polyphosphate:nucleotide phosphotransferase
MKTIHHDDLRVAPGRRCDLAAFDPAATGAFAKKADAAGTLSRDVKRLAALQDVFYANDRYALLIVFQGMDAAGKDGAIGHVMTGVNPQGVDVHAFKTPTPLELAHDYLWRCVNVLPERGKIGIFNRSYYEETIVTRVHPAILAAERLPAADTDGIWAERFEDINAFERHLVRNGTIVLKFFLHLSKHEQRKRLLERIDTPEKNWKLSADDVPERAYWDEYQRAYAEMLAHTSTNEAPWYVVPADHKWFTRAAVASTIIAKLESLDLHYPDVTAAQRTMLAASRERLKNEPTAE